MCFRSVGCLPFGGAVRFLWYRLGFFLGGCGFNVAGCFGFDFLGVPPTTVARN